MKENKQANQFFEEFIGLQVDRVYATPSDVSGYKSVTFCFNNGESIRLDARIDTSGGAFPAISVSRGNWETAKVEKLPNNMRCCKCKLQKKLWKIVCDRCGGTTYEGFYDKELDECVDEGKPGFEAKHINLIGVKILEEKLVEEMTTKELVESPSAEEVIPVHNNHGPMFRQAELL